MKLDIIQAKLKKIQNFELDSIDVFQNLQNISLHFSFSGDARSETILSLASVIHFVCSRAPSNDDTDSYYVGEVSIEKINSGLNDMLDKLCYGFVDGKGKTFTYPDLDIYHLHIEGEIVIDIFCQYVKLAKYLGQ